MNHHRPNHQSFATWVLHSSRFATSSQTKEPLSLQLQRAPQYHCLCNNQEPSQVPIRLRSSPNDYKSFTLPSTLSITRSLQHNYLFRNHQQHSRHLQSHPILEALKAVACKIMPPELSITSLRLDMSLVSNHHRHTRHLRSQPKLKALKRMACRTIPSKLSITSFLLEKSRVSNRH